MTALGISVEGQTEERVVKTLVVPHLAEFGVHATPVIVATSRAAGGPKAKGGGINVDRVASELTKLLGGYRHGFVTTLYDFYGFGDRQPDETVDALQERIASKVGRPRNLIPYVQKHEFEALLLSDAAVAADYFQAGAIEPLIIRAVRQCGGAEEVNDGPTTAPSKRLERWTAEHADIRFHYRRDTKTRHAPDLAEELGLERIRAACPRFDAWIARLEAL